MPTQEEKFLAELALRIDRVVKRIAIRHYLSPTQEPQLTPRIAQAIEDELDHFQRDGLRLDVEITTQDIPDRGNPAERHSGTDLYISIARLDLPIPISKGILIQAKWSDDLYVSEEHARLVEQCKKMRKRSRKASFVWAFAPDGVRAVKVPRLGRPNLTRLYESSALTPGRLIADSLKCSEGDQSIGRDLSLPIHAALTSMVSRLGAERWMALTVKPT